MEQKDHLKDYIDTFTSSFPIPTHSIVNCVHNPADPLHYYTLSEFSINKNVEFRTFVQDPEAKIKICEEKWGHDWAKKKLEDEERKEVKKKSAA